MANRARDDDDEDADILRELIREAKSLPPLVPGEEGQLLLRAAGGDESSQERLIAAYLPKEKILVEADGFNPPAQINAPPPNPVNPNTVNLVENIDRLKLDVETIIPIHYPADSRKVAMAELTRAVGKKD